MEEQKPNESQNKPQEKKEKGKNQRQNRNPKGRKANIVGPHADVCTSSKFMLIIITLTFSNDVVYVW